jgi:hypothetical protein
LLALDLAPGAILPPLTHVGRPAPLGLPHVARTAPHTAAGLTTPPVPHPRPPRAAHGDFYVDEHGIIGPNIVDGRLRIGSLHCTGFGFAVEPDMASMEPMDSWTFESLGFEA